MAPTRARNWLVAALLIFCVGLSQSLQVEFYSSPLYEEYQGEVTLNSREEQSCHTLKRPIRQPSSIKTDKCIIYYDSDKCQTGKNPDESSDKVIFRSKRLDSSNEFIKDSIGMTVKSLHVCSQTLGGGRQLDFDIFEFPSGISGNRKLLEGYRGLCGCQNVPKYIQLGKTKPLSTDHHGNAVILYKNENCEGEIKRLSADSGYNPFNDDTDYVLNLSADVRSFRPDNLDNCYRFVASITKFQFIKGDANIKDLLTQDVRLAVDSIMTNNGAAELNQQFKLSKKITTTIEYSVAEAYTKTESAGVEAGLEVTVESGVPGIVSGSVTASIKGSYNWSWENKTEVGKKETVSTEEAIEVMQEVKIPACKVCTVSAFVKNVKDYPLKYLAYARISTAKDAKQVSADELKKNMPAGMTYVRTIDAHTVEGVTEGTMYAEYGLSTAIAVNCDKDFIDGCMPTSPPTVKDHEEYVSPIKVIGQQRSASVSRRSTFFAFVKNSVGLIVKHLN